MTSWGHFRSFPAKRPWSKWWQRFFPNPLHIFDWFLKKNRADIEMHTGPNWTPRVTHTQPIQRDTHTHVHTHTHTHPHTHTYPNIHTHTTKLTHTDTHTHTQTLTHTHTHKHTRKRFAWYLEVKLDPSKQFSPFSIFCTGNIEKGESGESRESGESL